MRGGRNNLLAGSLVLVSLVAAVMVVVLLGGYLEMVGKRDYRVRFTINDGVTGLEAGSRVMLGGRPVGVVKDLEFDIDANGFAQSLEVIISVDDKIRLRQGAVALLISPLLGGSGQINFRSAGMIDGLDLGPSDIIEGRIAPPSLLADAGYGPEQKAQVQNIIKQVNDSAERASAFLTDARGLAADLRQKWPEWSQRVDSTLKNVDETAAKGPAIADSADQRLQQLRDALDTVQAYLNENRENVRDAIGSAKSVSGKADTFMDRLNGELSSKAASFLDEARAAFGSAQDAVNKIAMLRDEQLPNVRRMMANFRLASDQLASTLAEVRRSPWRLLYRPDKRELDFELLYDSARQYAAAVGDLRSTSETIQSLAAGGLAEKPRVDGLLKDLDAAFARYQEAEGEFLRQLSLGAQPAK